MLGTSLPNIPCKLIHLHWVLHFIVCSNWSISIFLSLPSPVRRPCLSGPSVAGHGSGITCYRSDPVRRRRGPTVDGGRRSPDEAAVGYHRDGVSYSLVCIPTTGSQHPLSKTLQPRALSDLILVIESKQQTAGKGASTLVPKPSHRFSLATRYV